MVQKITQHEGKKYLRKMRSAVDDKTIMVDVYCVLKAFGVTCPATSHAVKKLLCAGERGKGSRTDDLKGAIAAINRAVELSMEDKQPPEEPSAKIGDPNLRKEIDDLFRKASTCDTLIQYQDPKEDE